MSEQRATAGRLAGKRALITGAGRGIGKAIAEKFLAEGAELVIVDLVPDRLADVVTALSHHGPISGITGDVTDGACCQELVTEARQRLGGLDVLINNAGVATVMPASPPWSPSSTIPSRSGSGLSPST